MFCPECGGLMRPEKGRLTCPKCGYSRTPRKEDRQVITEKSSGREIRIISEEETLPKAKVTCEKCGNNEAYYVIRQMRAADEPETIIYQCTKCGHKWRK